MSSAAADGAAPPGPAPEGSAGWRLLVALSRLACVPTLAALGARWFWFCDLLTHFRVHYAAVLALFVAAFITARRWRPAVIPALVLAYNIGLVLPLYTGPEPPAGSGAKLRLLVANVSVANRRTELLVDLVRRERPDILVVVEASPLWLEALAPFAAEFPHRIERPANDPGGIVLWSRIEADQLRALTLGEDWRPALTAELAAGGRSLGLVALHTAPPLGGDLTEIRDRELRAAAALARSAKGPFVVCGDFNATPWSQAFREMLESGGLLDSESGFGLQPTWLAQLGPFGLPIDHVIASPHVIVHDRRVSGGIGSDHRAVIVDFSLADF